MSAKCYLCTVDDVYLNQLSPASVQSLVMQGGPMNGEEAAAFVALRHANDAVNLRLWDDEAKQAGLNVPGLDTYVPYLQRMMLRAASRP